ncbi:MAG: hypothetical protein ACI379_15340 [Nocardioides sp.]|uniref:hypothetical protein n=1 Tax=Nocardioides sp. TaxID=35761 RepID=UPI003EFC10B2
MGSQPSQQPQVSRSASRRRQRSTRITVAVSLLVAAAVLVAGAVVVNTGWLSSLAAVLAVVAGAAATKITHSELLLSRKEAARDRAAQAKEYAELTRQRADENATFAATMRKKIVDREEAISALEEALSAAQKHVLEQTRKLNAEARRAEVAERTGAETARALGVSEDRAAEAIMRVAEMEAELDVLRAELVEWKAGRGQARTA